MMRQIDWSLKELLAELKNPSSRYPRCFIVNEIGKICNSDSGEAKKAEEVLRDLLDSDNSDDKVLALCWLWTIINTKTDIDQQILLKVKEFEENPANRKIVADAKEALRNRGGGIIKNNRGIYLDCPCFLSI